MHKMSMANQMSMQSHGGCETYVGCVDYIALKWSWMVPRDLKPLACSLALQPQLA